MIAVNSVGESPQSDSLSVRTGLRALRSTHDDATLSALTVAPKNIIGFTANLTFYEVGIASTVTQATVAATPTNNSANAVITPADADGGTAGHQVNLSTGKSTVTVTVTAQDGTTTKAYTVHINRGVTADFGWKASHDLDALIAAGNHGSTGIWSDGTTMWVADHARDKLYAYNLSSKALDDSKDFDTLVAAGNGALGGIWSDGTTMWVADNNDDKLYAYNLSSKARGASKDITTLSMASNDFPTGIWSDGTTMWVADLDDEKLYAYNLDDKSRDASKEFNTLRAAGNDNPRGIWSDKTTMWVVDNDDDKVYSYNIVTTKPRPAPQRGGGNVLWAVDLTIGHRLSGGKNEYGYSAEGTAIGSVTNDRFTRGGTTYTVNQLFYTSTGGTPLLELELDQALPGNYVLNIGDHLAYEFDHANVSSGGARFTWSQAIDPGLVEGSTLRVSLTVPPAANARARPGQVRNLIARGETVGDEHHVTVERGQPVESTLSGLHGYRVELSQGYTAADVVRSTETDHAAIFTAKLDAGSAGVFIAWVTPLYSGGAEGTLRLTGVYVPPAPLEEVTPTTTITSVEYGHWRRAPFGEMMCEECIEVNGTTNGTDQDLPFTQERIQESGSDEWVEGGWGSEPSTLSFLLTPGTYYVEVRHGDASDNPVTEWSPHKRVKVRPNTSACGEAPGVPRNVTVNLEEEETEKVPGTTDTRVVKRVWRINWDAPSDNGGWRITKYYYGDTEGPDHCQTSRWPHRPYHVREDDTGSFEFLYVNFLAGGVKFSISAVNAEGESSCVQVTP